MTTRPRLHPSLALATAVVALATACGSGDDAVAPYTIVSDGTLASADEIRESDGEIVLTVAGRIDSPTGAPIELDMQTLESIGLVAYEVDDEQAEGRVVTFEGVLLSDLLDVVGAAPDASVLHATALNDYVVDIPISDVIDHPVLLATSVDGERMSVARYGPTRVVYPYHLGGFDPTVFDPRWIWQLASIEVR